MKREKANMVTLAKALNLSTATVSKALRDCYDISDKTKLKVKEAARQLNYVPNPYAGSLRNHSSKTIAIVIPEIADSFFSQAINGIESIANKEDFHALIYLTHDSYEREVTLLNGFKSGRVDGVLMSVGSNTGDTAHISGLQESGVPVIFFDRICPQVEAANVSTDDFDSAYRATSHLLQQGCKRISLITIRAYPSIFAARAEGFRKALTDNHISTGNIVSCLNKYSGENSEVIKAHLADGRPDGLLLTVEHLATSAYLGCRELGISIPEDLKIAC
ncbi:MAG: LacI family DNA-binding transcriptional regulator, partial [Mucilaginibacter sp.]